MTDAAPSTPPSPPIRKQSAALFVICVMSMAVGIDNLILTVALPTLSRDLNASPSDLQWIVAAYTLVFAGLLLLCGALADRFGRARIYKIGVACFGAASALAAWAPSSEVLIICRGSMGLGAALLAPASLAIISNVFADPTERGRAFAKWAAAGGVGLAAGPIAGGVLLANFGWGSVFLVNVPITAVVLGLSFWALPESRDHAASPLDPVGAALSVGGLGALIWATIQAPARGWLAPVTVLAFGAALVILALLVVWELRCRFPMLHLRFFRNARFTAGALASAAAHFAFAGVLFVITQLLQFVYGYSPLEAGVRLIPLAVTFVLMALVGARLAERLGTKYVVALGLGIFAAGLCVLLATGTGRTDEFLAMGAMLLIGTGFGMLSPTSTEAIMGSVPREKAGFASSTSVTTRQMGAAFGVAVLGSLLVSGYRSSLGGSDLGLTRRAAARARASLGDALDTAHGIGGATGRGLGDAARAAFVHGMHVGMAVAAIVMILSALAVLRYLPARADQPEEVGGDPTPPSDETTGAAAMARVIAVD